MPVKAGVKGLIHIITLMWMKSQDVEEAQEVSSLFWRSVDSYWHRQTVLELTVCKSPDKSLFPPLTRLALFPTMLPAWPAAPFSTCISNLWYTFLCWETACPSSAWTVVSPAGIYIPSQANLSSLENAHLVSKTCLITDLITWLLVWITIILTNY